MKAKQAAETDEDTNAVDFQKYEVEYCLESLVGRWRDTKAKASSYEVSVGDDSKVTIRTTRHDGLVLVTTGLVRTDSNSGWIIWGPSGPRYWLTELDSRSLKWDPWEHRCQHAAAFVWYRVGEYPAYPKSEKDRPTRTSHSKLRQELEAQREKEREDDFGTPGRSKGSPEREGEETREGGNLLDRRMNKRKWERGQKAKNGWSSECWRQWWQEQKAKKPVKEAKEAKPAEGEETREGGKGGKLAPPPLAALARERMQKAGAEGEETREGGKGGKLAPPPLAALARERMEHEDGRGASSSTVAQGKQSRKLARPPLPLQLALERVRLYPRSVPARKRHRVRRRWLASLGPQGDQLRSEAAAEVDRERRRCEDAEHEQQGKQSPKLARLLQLALEPPPAAAPARKRHRVRRRRLASGGPHEHDQLRSEGRERRRCEDAEHELSLSVLSARLDVLMGARPSLDSLQARLRRLVNSL